MVNTEFEGTGVGANEACGFAWGGGFLDTHLGEKQHRTCYGNEQMQSKKCNLSLAAFTIEHRSSVSPERRHTA